MKTNLFATIALSVLFIAILVNSFYLQKTIEQLYKDIEKAPVDGDVYEAYFQIYNEYVKKRDYLSLTINHNDTSEIEDIFAEILGAAKATDEQSVIIGKSRLLRALSHTKRLSGINLDSIL